MRLRELGPELEFEVKVDQPGRDAQDEAYDDDEGVKRGCWKW